MFVYTVVFLVILFGVFHFDYRNEKFGKDVYAFVVFVLMTLMVGLRYRVGGDALSYEDYYVHMPDLYDYFPFIERDVSFNYQPLYLLFIAICKSINPEYAFYQLIHAIVVNIIVMRFIYKNSTKFFTSVFLLYGLCIYFYFTYDIQREILAICCFLLGFRYFQNNKWVPYYVFAVLGFLFHISASILFVLPFFKLVKLKKSNIYIIVIVSFALSFAKSYFYDFISIFFVTESMAEKGKIYSEMDFSIAGMIFFFVGRVFFLLPIVFYYTKHKDEKMDTIITAFFILSCLSQVMVGFDRMLNYVTIPFIICFSHFIYSPNVFRFKLSKKFIIFSTYICLFYYICIKIVMDFNVTDRARYQAVFFPYSSVFDKETYPEREQFMIELWKR